jgi:alkylhydroperoxidase family enzyme
MARIAYPRREDLSKGFRDLLESMPRHAPVEMLAHSENLNRAFLRTAQVQFTDLELSPRHRELLILTVAALVECEYEYSQHVSISEAAGIDPSLRESIWSGALDEADLADEADRALVGLVRDIIGSPQVSDERFLQARAHLSDRQIVETLQLVGFYWGLGRLCTVLHLEIDTVDGVASMDSVANLSAS